MGRNNLNRQRFPNSQFPIQFIFDLQRFGSYPITDTFGDNKDWSYTLTEDGTLTITGKGAMPDFTSDNPLWQNYSSDIKKIVIGENVTSISNGAFEGCSDLTSLDLSQCTNLTTISNFAFYNCSKLASLDLSKCTNLTSIGASAFSNCSKLESITLPASLTTLGNNAFDGCSGLTSVDLRVAVA